MRESLFNIVTARLDLTGLSVLDLYAGSGALGLEALSRGAASALFVESDRRAAAVLDAQHRDARPARCDAAPRAGGDGVGGRGAQSPVDLVLADPPYEVDAAEVDAVLAALSTHGWAHDGTLVRSSSARPAVAPLSWPAGWQPWQQRVYGDTRLELAERL